VESRLTPFELLKRIKVVEEEVGRVTTFRNGPRVVDLDIVYFDELLMDNTDSEQSDRGSDKGDLIIPHPRAEEREFVLRPIAEYVLHRRRSNLTEITIYSAFYLLSSIRSLSVPFQSYSTRFLIPDARCTGYFLSTPVKGKVYLMGTFTGHGVKRLS
jgi:hypothetical protein